MSSKSPLSRRSFLRLAAVTSTTVPVKLRAQPLAPKSPAFFPGFRPVSVATKEATINGVVGGSGPPVLLLHGYPQTHLIWQKVARDLANQFTVVCTDLRGYGDSSVPPDGNNHEGYSKRTMAEDQVEVMRSLGHSRFSVIGHDRGGRVGHRMALDHPNAVAKLAVLDIVPTLRLYTTVTKEFATAYWHWFFLLQAAPVPETILLNSAEFFLRGRFLTSRAGDGASLIPEAISEATFAEYLRNFKDPARMHAMCEDYRAGASIDLEHDRADLDKKVTCPVLALWGANNPAVAKLFDVLATWRERASDVQGTALQAGHYLPEQVPTEVVAQCSRFLRA